MHQRRKIISALVLGIHLQLVAQDIWPFPRVSPAFSPPPPPPFPGSNQSDILKQKRLAAAYKWSIPFLSAARDHVLSISKYPFRLGLDPKTGDWALLIQFDPSLNLESYLILTRMTDGKAQLNYALITTERLQWQLIRQKISNFRLSKPSLESITSVHGIIDSTMWPELIKFTDALPTICIVPGDNSQGMIGGIGYQFQFFGFGHSSFTFRSQGYAPTPPLVAWSESLLSALVCKLGIQHPHLEYLEPSPSLLRNTTPNS